MKKEQATKSKLWIVLVIAAAVLLIAGGVAAFFLLGPGNASDGPKGGRAEIYWNVDRVEYTKDSVAGLSTRQPDADGLFHIKFAIDGSQVEFACADKKVVNRIDMNMAMGLVFDADGLIVDMIAADTIATVVANSMYAQYEENGVLVVNSSVALNGMQVEVPITDITGIYNCDAKAEVVGAPGEVEPMDLVLAYQNDLGETTHVFVIERVPESKVYWRLERFYNSTTAQTTREPDENGVYTIAFAVDTQHVELKCKDADLVTAIDTKKDHNCAFGFTFDEEGYITGIIDPGLAVKGAAHATNMDIVEMTDTSFVALRRLPGTGQGSDYDGIITENTKIYNVNTSSEVMGEETQLQMGDRLFVLANTKNEAEIIFIINRLMDTPMYYTPSVKYDSTNRVTTRVPDAQGRYVYEVYYGGGEHLTVWTKNITLASQLDSYKYRGFGLKLSEDNEILDVYYHTCVYGYSYTLVNMFLTNITGQIIAGYSYTSEVAQTGIMREDCKVYDYSSFATVLGEETTLRMHDRVVTYRDSDGLIAEVHVLLRTALDTELYYNLGRKYNSTTKETTREPIDGWYVFTLAKDGKQVTAKTSSKELASKIDSFSPAAVALKVVNGIIYECYRGEYAFIGGSYRTSNYIVREIDMERSEFGSYRSDYTTVTLNPNVYRNIWTTMGEDVKVYNVSENVKSHRGEETTLQIGDKIHAIRDKSGDAVVIFVTLRKVKTGPAASWDYKYNETTGETSRKPDADGYYVYTIARDGKVGTYKTKDKALATKIDAFGDVFAFTNDGEIITNVLDIKYVNGIDSDTGSKFDVHAYGNGKITIKKNRPTASDAFKEYTFDVSSNVQVIDFTPGENFGQKGEVTLGDRIILLRDDKKVVQIICILQKNVREAGARGICPDCGEDVFWEPWTGGGFTTREGYHYYLAKDVEREAGLKFSNTDKDFKVVLDLNGHTITTNNRIAAIQNNETFVILDTSKAQTGKIQGVGSNTEGGANGGGLFIYGGNFKMYSGTVQLCEENLHNNKQGGTVYIGQNSTAELLGGKIIGADANTSGGAVHIVNSTVKIGGDVQILGGVAPKGNSVYVLGNSTVDISGNAVITGGMQVDAADKLTISGKPQITAGETSEYSLKLSTKVLLTLGAMEKGAKIGITAFETFTKALADEATAKAYATYFYSDEVKKSIVVQDNCLVAYQPPVAAPDAVCEHCGETVEWILWKGGELTEGGHYYLAYDVSMDAAVNIGDVEGDNFHVVLDLNGCTINSAKNVFMVRRGEKLTILDSSKDKTGTIIGTGRGTGSNAGVLQAYYKDEEGAAELEILGGTIQLKKGSKAKAGGVIHANAGTTVTIENATLIGGEVAENGGTIYAYDADLTVGEGTVVKAGTAAKNGDSIYVGSGTNLIIDGATIDGGIAVEAGVNVKLTGKVIIEKAQGGSAYSLIVDGVKVDATGLTAGSMIAVTKSSDGTFTTNFADAAAAEAAKAYFKADNGTTKINLAGNALCYGEPPVGKTAYCEHCDQTVEWFAWDGTAVAGDAHLFIPEEGTVVPSYISFKEGHVVIDLQGNALSSEKQMFRVGANADMYIIDSVGGGTVISKGESANGGIAMFNGAGHLTITGGTFALAEEEKFNEESYNGGLFAFYSKAGAKLTILGGTFKAAQAKLGDTIYITGTSNSLEIGGNAKIEGGVYVDSAEKVTLSGAPTIEKTADGSAYSLTVDSVKIDATGLTAGAKIAVTKSSDGIFTTNFADAAAAEAAKAYFKADNGTTKINLAGNALCYGEAPVVETAHCEYCDQDVIWTEWDGTAVTGDAHLTIPANGTVVSNYVSFKEGHVVIDLQGNALTGKKQLLRVGAGADMYIIDSVGGGTVAAKGENANGGIVMFNGAGHLTITGGTFSLSSDEVFKEDTYTGGLFAFTSKADAKLTITGGTFKATKAKLGDTIYILGTVNELEIGGNAVIEGGVYVDSAEKITISGTPTIQKVSGGSAYSLKLASGKVVDATGLTTGASIGVNADGVFTTAFADAAAAEAAKGFFTCEVSDKEISLAGTTLKVAEPAGDAPVDPDAPTAHCEYCDQDVVWTEWDGAAVTGDAHLVIPANGTALSSHVTFTNGHVVIDLQGHALTSDKQVFRVGAGANMYIIDSVGGGTVTGKGTTAHGGIAMFSGAGNLTITGGTFALAEDEAFNEAKYNGGLFAFTSSANGKLTITGGTFKATEAGKGDTIYILGTVNELEIGGNAVIEGGVYVDSAEKFTISGTPTIQKVSGGSAYSLKLTTGKVVDITGLTAGASIGITASDVFTTEFATEAAANAAKAYLTCEVADKEISLEGKALKVADPATEPAPEETTAPVVPEETTPEETTAPTQPAGEECEHCGQVVEWKTWDGLTFTEGGHYIVPENLAQLTTHAIVKEMEVVLDLNGQTVESTVKVFHVTDGGELTIVDSSAAKTGTVIGKGKGSGTHAGVIQVYESNAAAKLTILGGTYKMKEGSQAKNGGIIHTNKNCEVVVKNATIEGGTAALGAAIYVNGNVKLTVGEGAVIKAGKASTYGDTIYVTDKTPQIVIEGNARIEGGVYATSSAAGVITVKGTPVIQKVEGGSAYSFRGSSLTVGALEEGALIAVTKDTDGAFTTAFETPNAAAAAAKFFVADDATKEVGASGTELVVQAVVDPLTVPCNCETCKGEVPTWTAWDVQPITAAGHYYVAEDVALTGAIGVGNAEGENFTVVLNLNGKTISASDSYKAKLFLVKEKDTMIIMDSSAQGTGTMIGNVGTANAGLIQVYSGNLVVEGGNYYLSSDTASTKNGGIVYASAKDIVSHVTINGGEFWGGKYAYGAAIYQLGGSLTVNGGTIHPGTASKKGDSIYVETKTDGSLGNPTVAFGGDAKIEGGVEIKVAETLTVSGKAVIQKAKGGSAYSLKLADGVKLTVGTLEEGASIGVTAADGEFTVAFADEAAATAATAYFTTDDVAKAIKVVEKALAIGDPEAAA